MSSRAQQLSAWIALAVLLAGGVALSFAVFYPGYMSIDAQWVYKAIGGGYGDIEEAEFERAIGRALDLGVNCFDTAEGYGMGASERALREALPLRPRRAQQSLSAE